MLLSPNICPLCKRDVESSNHILLHCAFTSSFCYVRVYEGSFSSMGERGRGGRGRMFIKAILLGVMWGIWKEKNIRVFEDKVRSA